MKTMKIFAMAMVSMFCASVNANATEAEAPEMTLGDQVVKMQYVYETAKNEYELKDGEVVSKTIYKWDAEQDAWKPYKKYAVSKNADNSFLSCGCWDDSTNSFSANIMCQSYKTSENPALLVLPRTK